MIYSTITQNGDVLSYDKELPFQYSDNIEIKFIKDEQYNDYTVSCYYSFSRTSFIEGEQGLDIKNIVISDEGILTLPADAFKQNGYLIIGFKLSGVDDYPNIGFVTYKIKESIGGVDILPPDSKEWELLVTSFMKQYFLMNYKEVMDSQIASNQELIGEIKILKTKVIGTIDDLNIKIENNYFVPKHKFENGKLYFTNSDGTWDDGYLLNGDFIKYNTLYSGYTEVEGNTYSSLASDYGINIAKIEGNYEQKTTNGYQLFDFLENLTVKNATEIAIDPLNKVSCIIDVTKQKSVCFKCNNYSVFNSNVLRILELKEYPKAGVIGVRRDITSDKITKYPDDVKYLLVIVSKNTGITNDDVYKANLMINYGSEHLPWEPFTGGIPSPNPDYPQEIKSVEITKFNSHTNQLFDASKLPTKTIGGATLTNNGDGSFTISGTGTLTENFYIGYIYTHDETVKLLKAGALKTSKTNNIYPYFYVEFRQNGNKIGEIKWGVNTSTFNITQEMIEDKTFNIYISVWGNINYSITTGTIKPMLYQDGDGTWEQFKLVTTTLPKPLVLRALPNLVCDTYENGNITRRVSEAVFDGSSDENWIIKLDAVGFTRYSIKISDIKNNGNVRYIALFNNFSYLQSGDKVGGAFIYSNDMFIYPPSDITTVALLRTWLQSNNLKVYYELATPITEQFSIPTLPSFYPYTNICHDSVVEAKNIVWNVKNDFRDELKKVAFTGKYSDLIDKPEIPSNVVNSLEIKTVKVLTQAQYDALATKDSNTLYVVVG